ncbi:MAG: hypothetical protein SF066_03835 [Thermoanaerobaculia bacterium]|nr:hypothetical protein [Thermoanaerobaculia bacterium]
MRKSVFGAGLIVLASALPAAAEPQQSGLWARMWAAWLSPVWEFLSLPAGNTQDPNGVPPDVPEPAVTTNCEAGNTQDPNGQCRPIGG